MRDRGSCLLMFWDPWQPRYHPVFRRKKNFREQFLVKYIYKYTIQIIQHNKINNPKPRSPIHSIRPLSCKTYFFKWLSYFQLSDDPFDGKRIDVSQAPVLVKNTFNRSIVKPWGSMLWFEKYLQEKIGGKNSEFDSNYSCYVYTAEKIIIT
jgi:hypothetical protein